MSAAPLEDPAARAAAASPDDAWRRLSAAQTADGLCKAWLEVLARSLVPARTATLLLAQPDGSFAPVAVLPAGRDTQYLAEIATESLRQREGTVRRDELGHVRLAYPLQAGARLDGAVVLDLGPADEAAVERAMRLTHWGAGWLLDLMNQRELSRQLHRTEQAGFLLDTLLATLHEGSAREAALMLVNRIGRHLDCQQVQLATPKGRTLQMLAISHAAWFDERAGLINQALQAMHEAYDQRQRIVWPAQADAPIKDKGAATLAHARYAEQACGKHLCSLPLIAGHELAGVLMCERDRPFSPEELTALEAMALAAAPVIQTRQQADQGAFTRARKQATQAMQLITGPRYPAIKLGAATLAVFLVATALIPGTFRISAQAVVEGAVQRAAAAPFDGFVREAPARAGDVVKAGQLLALLDDKDLKLEKLRWESELEVAQQKEREAMAKGNRVDQRLAAAQANQARAQLDLALSKLARIHIAAPFDGVVVKGDLSQQLGSPIEQGKVLFELAPLDAWRVILKVDDRDITHVQPGAIGTLRLSSLPGQSWPFKVRKLTPISVAEDGRTYFRVEAELDQHAPKLRPNMEGVGKIEAGEHSLLWIWTHGFVEWLRMSWWHFMP
ncbi:MAG: HlyD family efflux transporter periplasmic adaptor subunit [Aquabacterium sp.]